MPQGLSGKIRTDRLFADNVRFLAMAAIVYLHSWGICINALHASPSILVSYLAQVQKFGTIGFFLISGFLFGERIGRQGPLQYFMRRLRNVFIPWLVWLSLFCTMVLAKDYFLGKLSSAETEIAELWSDILHSAFWFVPNLLLALAILLVFRRVLDDLRTGLVFLAASLFYGVNIYGHWVPVQHTRAAFGFVFYLWLGAWSALHFQTIEKQLARIPMKALFGALIFTQILALIESRILSAMGSVDPMNTLRITNQLYSVVAVIAIVKLRRPVWPGFVDVREQTFGLYLTHTFALAYIHLALRMTVAHWKVVSWFPGTSSLVLTTIVFAFTYFGCLMVVKTLMAHPMLRWTVGLPPRAQGKDRSAKSPALVAAMRLTASLARHK